MPRNQEEHGLQKAVVDYVINRRNQDPLWALIFAVPNGDHRTTRVGRRLLEEGVMPGVADMIWLLPTRIHNGLLIEHKAEGGSLSKPQKHWLAAQSYLGYRREVYRSSEETIATLEEHYRMAKSAFSDITSVPSEAWVEAETHARAYLEAVLAEREARRTKRIRERASAW